MTGRKPVGMSFGSWIDQQISEAGERGAFDDLPGAGKPLPKRRDDYDGQAWLRDYLKREGVSADEMLPPPLKLRKEREQLAAAAPGMRSEQEVREAVSDLNWHIVEHRRIPVGPPVFVPLADEEAMVASWQAAHPKPSPRLPAAGTAADTAQPAAPRRARRGWRRRREPGS
jgi:hypothetical protein